MVTSSGGGTFSLRTTLNPVCSGGPVGSVVVSIRSDPLNVSVGKFGDILFSGDSIENPESPLKGARPKSGRVPGSMDVQIVCSWVGPSPIACLSCSSVAIGGGSTCCSTGSRRETFTIGPFNAGAHGIRQQDMLKSLHRYCWRGSTRSTCEQGYGLKSNFP